MLTVDDFIKVYQHAVDLHLKEKPHKSSRRGVWREDYWKVLVYIPAHDNLDDLYKTIIHEFIHARNDLVTPEMSDLEEDVEAECIETFIKNPEVIDYIKECYQTVFDMADLRRLNPPEISEFFLEAKY
jgi:hypothetical protein